MLSSMWLNLTDDGNAYSSMWLNFPSFPDFCHRELCNSVISHIQRNPPKLFLTVSVLVWPADDWSGTELTGWLRLSWERRPITGQHHLSQIYRQLGSSCAAHSLSSSEVGEVVHSMTNGMGRLPLVQNFSPWWVKCTNALGIRYWEQGW